MQLLNTTRLQAGYTMATDKAGRDWLVVVAKGTYGIPDRADREPSLLDEQVPLVMTDVFTGEPGCSAPLYEIDFAPRKPRCEVLLNGSAYAPAGKPATRVTVSLRVGSWTKSFDVVGKRVWNAALLGYKASKPEPFTVLPISYDNAFGGVDRTAEDEAKHRWYPSNHAGAGYYENTAAAALDGKPMPSTEETDDPITRCNGKYRPMAFGPIGRSWQQRIKWAGTYDKKWLDETYPFLPRDFDDRYFQAAPEDQWIEHPRGGEEVTLTNLTPQGRTTFRLPRNLELPVVFFLRSGGREEFSATMDTLVIEPDLRRFTLTWRAARAVRRNLLEMRQFAVGKSAREWQHEEDRQRRLRDKRRFASLAELAAAARQQRVPVEQA